MRLLRERIIYHGERIPRFYRVAYEDWFTWSVYAYPVGVHWLARWARRLHELSYRYRASKMEEVIAEAKRQAYSRGRQAGEAAVRREWEAERRERERQDAELGRIARTALYGGN